MERWREWWTHRYLSVQSSARAKIMVPTVKYGGVSAMKEILEQFSLRIIAVRIQGNTWESLEPFLSRFWISRWHEKSWWTFSALAKIRTVAGRAVLVHLFRKRVSAQRSFHSLTRRHAMTLMATLHSMRVSQRRDMIPRDKANDRIPRQAATYHCLVFPIWIKSYSCF